MSPQIKMSIFHYYLTFNRQNDQLIILTNDHQINHSLGILVIYSPNFYRYLSSKQISHITLFMKFHEWVFHTWLSVSSLPISNWAQLKLQRWFAVTFWKPCSQGLHQGDACFSWSVAPLSETHCPPLGIYASLNVSNCTQGEMNFLACVHVT